MRIVRLGKGHWWFHDTATKYGGAAVAGCRCWTAFRRPTLVSHSCSSGLSGGATTHQLSSAGVPQTFRRCLVFVRNHLWPGSIRRIGRKAFPLSNKETDMCTERCPLCYVPTRYEEIEHLTRDHRRSYAEACALVERSKEGTLGRNAQNGRQKVLSSPASAKIAPTCANPITSESLWLPVPSPFRYLGFW